MKKKIILMVALVVVFVAMIGVGFAGWQISQNAEKSTTAGVQTESVVDNAYTLTDLNKDADNFQFGVPQDSISNSGKWLTYSTTQSVYEDLDIIVTGTVGKASGTLEDLSGKTAEMTNNNLTVTITGTYVQVRAVLEITAGSEAITAASGLVTSPTITSMTIQQNGALSVTIGCSWGTDLNSSNPYTYYNEQEYSTQLATKAVANLQKIEALSGVTLKLTIYVEAVSA